MSTADNCDTESFEISTYGLQGLFIAGVAGDPSKYSEFLIKTAEILRRSLRKKVPSSDVDDVIQEILSSIHRSRHTYDDTRPIVPWIFAIARFRVTDYLRKIYANRRSDHEIEKLALEALDVTPPPPSSESVAECLEELPKLQQALLRSMYLEGLTARETGERLGMRESAVKTAAHRVLKKLRLTLSGRT